MSWSMKLLIFDSCVLTRAVGWTDDLARQKKNWILRGGRFPQKCTAPHSFAGFWIQSVLSISLPWERWGGWWKCSTFAVERGSCNVIQERKIMNLFYCEKWSQLTVKEDVFRVEFYAISYVLSTHSEMVKCQLRKIHHPVPESSVGDWHWIRSTFNSYLCVSLYFHRFLRWNLFKFKISNRLRCWLILCRNAI